MWLSDMGCSDTVCLAWGLSSPDATMPQIAGKIKTCGDSLSIWSKHSFGCIKKMIEVKIRLLSKAEVAVAKGLGDCEEVKTLQLEVNALLDKESQMWEQRARTLFLKCCNRNTSYFHSKASHRHHSEYSVKSGYKLLMDQAANNRPGPSDIPVQVYLEWCLEFKSPKQSENSNMAGGPTCPVVLSCFICGLGNPLCLVIQDHQVARPLPLSHSTPLSPIKWSPLPVNWVKVNFDGALFKDTSSAGLGVIIRNNLGLAMAASSQLIPLPTSALNSTSYSSSSFGHIIRDIKIAASVLIEVVYCHTRRQGNKVAHKIARLACNVPSFNVWMEEVPPDIAPLYVSELT
nr:hypothetical protein CFP56_35478 [Quercus suber]